MKIVSILGGLGSQMFKYAFYLALKEKTKQECYIDNTFFSQRECWNGYELNRIFGIDAPNITSILSEEEKESIKNDTYYLNVILNKVTSENDAYYYLLGKKHKFKKNEQITTKKLELIKKITYVKFMLGVYSTYSLDDVSNNNNEYFDEYFHNSDEHFEEYKDLIKKAFVFPDFNDDKNAETAKRMLDEESVAIHIRRSDHLSDNSKLFKNGFYKKSVQYIKEMAKSRPTYYIFSDDLDWCINNLDSLGLSEEKVTFVDWNKKDESFRDMQLMTYCKHNIIPISSFSWWGYYLSDRKDKIVIAPKKYWKEVPIHF